MDVCVGGSENVGGGGDRKMTESRMIIRVSSNDNDGGGGDGDGDQSCPTCI